MLRTALLAAAALGLAAPALAGTDFTANLETPKEERVEFVANKAIWVCQGDVCSAELDRRKPTVRTCKKVVEEIGRLVAFTSERGELTAEELERCNAAARD